MNLWKYKTNYTRVNPNLNKILIINNDNKVYAPINKYMLKINPKEKLVKN
jgi:hypothetical protein